MRPIKSRAMAFDVAWMLKRLTGDETAVFPLFGVKSGRLVGWRVVRVDPSGKDCTA